MVAWNVGNKDQLNVEIKAYGPIDMEVNVSLSVR